MFDACLYFNTAALARRLERLWAEAFALFVLTPPQAFMLRALLREPGLLQGQLAKGMAISRPTATRALDGLAAKGLVTRSPSAADGRETVLHPTPEAERLRAALDEASGLVTAQLRAVLSDATFDTTVGQIRSVRQALD